MLDIRLTQNVNTDLWTLLYSDLIGISNLPFLSPLHTRLHELVINGFLHIHARAGTAALAHVKEEPKVGLFNCMIN